MRIRNISLRVVSLLVLTFVFVVATSDGMEQIIILGHGALRVSARMFHEEVQNVEKQIRKLVQGEA